MIRPFELLARAVGLPESRENLRPDQLHAAFLKEALRKPGCPLCRMLRDADRYYLKVFLREGKYDGRMLLRLLGSWGSARDMPVPWFTWSPWSTAMV